MKRISPVTNAEEFYYPPWKRLLFQLLVSLPVCLFCLSFVFLAMLGCFELQVRTPRAPPRESRRKKQGVCVGGGAFRVMVVVFR